MHLLQLTEEFFEFHTNEYFAKEWKFLPDAKVVDVIATQLSYLSFHDWIGATLKTVDTEAGELRSRPKSLYGPVGEGFHRTNVLLYAAICEGALNCALAHAFSRRPNDPALIDCFQMDDVKYVEACSVILTSSMLAEPSKLCFRHTKKKRKTIIDFKDFIQTALKASAIEATLSTRLEKLRELRNTIHLAKLTAHKEAKNQFHSAHTKAAKEVVDQLRVQLKKYLATI